MRRLRALTAGVAMLAASVAAAAEKPVIAAVNYPLAYFAERLGGDAVEVLFPIPADADPAFWRPKLKDIAAIQAADLIALNGAGYAAWTTKASLRRSRIVDTSAGFSDDYIQTETVTHSHGDGGEHSHAAIATHTWLDFALAARQAEALASAMARRVPEAAATVDAARSDLIGELEALDREAAAAAEALRGRAIIATHPRYQYFARAYGLDIRSLEWEAGEAPSEKQWRDLTALAEETGAAILLWEAAPPDAARERAAAAGFADAMLPTLANRPGTGDFLSAMRSALADLAALAPTD
ncbi:MAG: metal ABC transporter substrate-binding protein [Pseudomonadota bacterium]